MGTTEVKNKKKGHPPPRMNKKWKKTAFRPSDEQKTRKIDFPTPRMNKKREKLAFQPLG